PQSSTLAAVFSGVERKGRWLVEEHTNIACLFGGAELDFRQAVLSRREVTVNISCLFGGVEIIVPPGVRVMPSMFAIFAGSDCPEDDTVDPDAPVIRLTGMLLFGGVSVTRRAVDERYRRGDRHHRIHEAHRRREEKLDRRQGRREESLRRRDERRDRLRELRAERHRNH
ncbi:LiaF domain-containing protein, partial [Actinomadura rubrisoli]